MKAVVIGGAGFIGSHVVDRLVGMNHDVLVVDNLLNGDLKNINKNAKFINKNILGDLSPELKDAKIVFHFAADADVRSSMQNLYSNFEINVKGTISVLEACRKMDIERIIFASTSAVYGMTEIIPTPEDAVLKPISNYGASKMASEAYLSTYSNTYGICGSILRFANIYGERSRRGVMFDFFNKLRKNSDRLEILGNGNQDKSYLYISDCVSAIMAVLNKQTKIYDVFNVGSKRKIKVKEIANLVCNIMKVRPTIVYSSKSKFGWTGDVPTMLLDVKKLERLGWREEISLSEGLERYIMWLLSIK
ncbi:MAG: NAD-dependent epimerase/dehydratase family protein [Candidatus Aenigmarchaeota archaeon]|nr:NAD-dependent epimerase/dehydratase family protein [Candidatus Aenigmarchaeota archaeon]